MFILTNDQLTVEILDPDHDQANLGARYCCGGYIFQITDQKVGPLLSGPTFPAAPNTFDGQGIPDAFNLSPLRTVGDPDQALIVGVGMCKLHQNYQKNSVIAFDSWSVTKGANSVEMVTSQTHAAWNVYVKRTVTLLGRTVRSNTLVVNHGSAPIPLCWFPHPFYPQPVDDALIKLNIPVTLAQNDGYQLTADGIIRRLGAPIMPGHYLALAHEARVPLVVQQRHPLLGLVTASTSYIPAFFPIWGNANTFSWEPFLERTIAPGHQYAWSIDYDF